MKKRKQHDQYKKQYIKHNSNINKVKNNFTVNVQDTNSYKFGSVALSVGNRTGKFPNLSTLMANCFNLNTQTFNTNEDIKIERVAYLASYFDKKTQENKIFTSLKEEYEYINFNVFNIIKDFLLKYKTEIEIKEIDDDGDIRLNCYYRNKKYNEIVKDYYYIDTDDINNFFKKGRIGEIYWGMHIEDVNDKFLDYLEELMSIDEQEKLVDIFKTEDKTTKKRRL